MYNLKEIQVSLKLNFRDVAYNFIYIDFNDDIMDIVKQMGINPGHFDTGIFAYCYLHKQEGLVLEGLAFAHIEANGEKRIVKTNDVFGDMHIRIQMGALEGSIITAIYLDRVQGSGFEPFTETAESLLNKDGTTDSLIAMREDTSLDGIRNAYYPDDLVIELLAENKESEIVWVRSIAPRVNFLLGEILNEAKSDFGVHKGDIIPFGVVETDEGINGICIPDKMPEFTFEDVKADSSEQDLHSMLHAFQHSVLPEILFNCDDDEEDKEARLMDRDTLINLLANFLRYSYVQAHNVFPDNVNFREYHRELYKANASDGAEININVLEFPLPETKPELTFCRRLYIVSDSSLENPELYTVEYDYIQKCYFFCAYIKGDKDKAVEHRTLAQIDREKGPDKEFELDFIKRDYGLPKHRL